MGLLSLIGLGNELAKPIEAVSNLYTTDKARIWADTAQEEVEQQRGLAQLRNDGIMAASANFFTEAWQPMIAWTAGLCLALYYIPQLIVINLVWSLHVLESGHIHTFPINPDDLIHLVYMLFGFGGYNIAKKLIR